ncbi:hypothetical protein BFW38_13730 [Terasakiispira papahanaumokuakeensis]|uniref:HTH araC/xylS-type domain-containing protein n=1 Tax=Terasakiispira papahanaumokuakeensis TaxID=197479 RepID=A0A1E2VBV2_9GAMM|nr:AraC family transcriptional regulator [Terasakiispira papahanaumokuakeensis]ODC04434.1 hypothetical protein BFW38_13730 [Terasakiispira papahanaumokuakeensis]
MTPATAAPTSTLSTLDLLGFGQRFGIRYRFPEQSAQHTPSSTIAQGQTLATEIREGLHFTASNLTILQPYESISLAPLPLLMVVLLEGQLQGQQFGQRFHLRPGDLLCTHLHPETPLQVLHQRQPQLKTLTLAITSSGEGGLGLNPRQMPQQQSQKAPYNTHLPLSFIDHLENSLGRLFHTTHQPLLLEGLALQLLAYGLPQTPPTASASRRPTADVRLTRVYRFIEQHATDPLTLAELAQVATMSSSHLRQQFKRQFGCSLFDFQRHCRLRQARQWLHQGYSVQHVAHLCGYRHTSNFVTAYRRQFGETPGQYRESAVSITKTSLSKTKTHLKK